jgi:hypothetical protein
MPDEEGILKWCSSLVRRTPDGNRLELAHFTIEEFLLAIDGNGPNNPYRRYRISPTKQDLSLAKLCLTYLEFEDFDNNEWSGKDELNEFIKEYSFYQYATQYWYEHALAHHEDEGLLELAKILFDPSKTGNFICWSRFWIWNGATSLAVVEPISNTETLHFAAALLFYNICEWLVKEKGCMNDIDKLSDIGSPLFCALAGEEIIDFSSLTFLGFMLPAVTENELHERNKQRTFEYLLHAGARVDNIRVHPHFEGTPFSMALRINFGWDLLLERGATLDQVCLEEIEKLIRRNTALAESFLLLVSDKNLNDDIKST